MPIYSACYTTYCGGPVTLRLLIDSLLAHVLHGGAKFGLIGVDNEIKRSAAWIVAT